MKYTCRRCGEIVSVHDSWAHVCPEEESEKFIEARVDCSDPVVYQQLHLPNRCLCKGCGKYTDTHYLYPGGETRCWECTFLPKMDQGEPAEQLDSLVDGSIANLVNHDHVCLEGMMKKPENPKHGDTYFDEQGNCYMFLNGYMCINGKGATAYAIPEPDLGDKILVDRKEYEELKEKAKMYDDLDPRPARD